MATEAVTIWHIDIATGRANYSISQEICTRFYVLCFVVVMESFIMNSHEVCIHIHQGCFAGTGAIVRLSQCQWSKPDGYGKISQCITTTKHSKAKTVCIFLGIYCTKLLVADWIYWRFNMSVTRPPCVENRILNKQACYSAYWYFYRYICWAIWSFT